MASDPHPIRTAGDAPSAADDAPSTSSAPAPPGGRRVKLMCAYGGKFLPRPIDGCLRYAGGETRIISLRRDSTLPEFLRKMAEAYGRPVAVRYQLPEEDLDALISVSTPEDLENMMEEVDKIAELNPSAKLRVFLFSPAELAGGSADQHYQSKDFQDQNTRYIEAVNGVGSRLPRKDSMASVSTQNSDGAIGAEATPDGVEEGTSPALPSPNATNAHDQSKPNFAVQNMPDLPTAISSIEQNEPLNATQFEIPPAAPYLQQSFADPQNSQFTSSQPFAVSGLHSQVNVAPLPPPSYVPATHGTLPTFSQPGNGAPVQRREGPFLEEKTSVGRIAKIPSDPIFSVQNRPDLPTSVSCIDHNEVIKATQFEVSPAAPSLQHSYVGPNHSQFTSSQPFSVSALHSQVNVAPLLPPSYIPVTHGILPPISQPGNVMPIPRRDDPILEEKKGAGNAVKVPSGPNSSMESMPNLSSAITSVDRNEIFNTTHSELPPVTQYLQQPYVDPPHSQFASSQSFAVGGLHSVVNVTPLPPSSYVLAMHGTISPTSQPSNVMPVQKKEDPVLEEKISVGNTSKVQSDPIVAVQNLPNLPAVISSIDQNETSKPTQSELHPVAPYLQQTYVDPHHSQFMSSQHFAVAGLHSHVNVAPLPQQSYVPATHGTVPPISQPSNGVSVQRRENTRLEEKTTVGKIPKVPSDPKVQPLSQLPPLPPPHFLTPKGQTLRSEECSLCQKTLPHAHSDTVINEQVNGPRVPNSEVKPVLQTHHSKDVTRMRVPQVGTTGTLSDGVTETNPVNLVSAAPLVSYELPCNNERPNVLVKNNLDHKRTLGQESTALMAPAPTAHIYVTNLQTAHHEATMQKSQVLNALGQIMENNGHSNFLGQPTLSIRPGENELLKSGREEDLQRQPHFPQNKIQHKQEPTNPQLVADISSLRNPNLQEDMFAQSSSCNKPLCVNPFVPSALGDQPIQIVGPKMVMSKDSRPDVLLSAVENSIAVNTMPLNDLLITNGVVPSGNACLSADPVASTEQNFSYIQSPEAARASHAFHRTENNLVINVGRSDYTYDSMLNKHPTEDRKDDTSRAEEVFGDTMIPHSGNAQIITNTDPFQGQISSNSLFFNDDPQKILGSPPVLSPSLANVSSQESIVMKEILPDIQPLHANDSAAMVLEGVSLCQSQLSDDMRTELVQPLKDLEHVDQDISASAEETVTPIVYLSNPSVDDFAPHHPNNEETGTKENSIERADEKDKTIKDTKKPERLNNGFPSKDDIGRHLQVIKNSDLEELRELGSGTFGTVYHGKWRGSDVAIKRLNELVFKGKPSDQERARADFWNEACKLSSLHHPNVVAFYGIVLDGPGGTIATVTEFMVNGSLRNALIKNDRTLDWRKRLLIAMDVAFGMEYLHSRNIIHFDLKSDNLLVNLRDPQRPICKVGDLGLSRVKFETLMSGGMRGTLPWMAPELLDGKTKCTEKIDVYSFGIVMWELLTGDEPYANLHYGAIIGGIVKNTLRPPVPDSCDAEWRSLMEQCWSIEPRERPNFTEIANRLRAMGTSIPQRG